MIHTFIFLSCESCDKATFPSPGECGETSYDGVLNTHRDLRQDARAAGWRRKKLEAGILRDLCPVCAKKAGGR